MLFVFSFCTFFDFSLSAATLEQRQLERSLATKKSAHKQTPLVKVSFENSGAEPPDTREFSLGKKSGLLVFLYEMYTIRDTLTVQLNGGIIFTTGGPVEGSGTFVFDIPASKTENILTVTVNPGGGEEGTIWNYTGSFNAQKFGQISGYEGMPNYIVDEPGQRPESMHADPIDTATGAHVIRHNLFTLWGAQPLTFTIDYHSLLTFNGVLGRGWSHNFEAHLENLDQEQVRIHWNQKRFNTFSLDRERVEYKAQEPSARFYQLQTNPDKTYSLMDRRNKKQWHFDVTGQLTSVQNASGLALNLIYNSSNQLTVIQEPISGRKLNLTYNEHNKISQVTDPGTSRAVVFTYDAGDLLTTIQQADGNVITYLYNPLGQILSGNDSLGTLFINTYDEEGRVMAQDDGRPESPLTYFAYLTKRPSKKKIRNLFSETNASSETIKSLITQDQKENKEILLKKDKSKKDQSERGREDTTLVLDRNHNLHFYQHSKELQLKIYTDPEKRRTHYRYDREGNLRSIQYPGQRRTSCRYNVYNQPSTLHFSGFSPWQIEYDSKNNLRSLSTGKTQFHSFDYDQSDRLTRYTDPVGKSYQLNYNAEGLLEQFIRPGGGDITYIYHQGRPRQIKDPEGALWNLTYDQAGRINTLQDPEGGLTTFTHDIGDRITSVTDALGNQTIYEYDLRGNLIEKIDAEGAVTTFNYDPHNQLIRITDAQAHATTFTYDAEDRLTSFTDALENITYFEYDKIGRPIAIINPLGERTRYHYDKTGNLIETLDSLNQSEFRIRYNQQNQPSRIQDDQGKNQENRYDSQGRLIHQRQGKKQSKQFDYDALDRLVQTKTSARQQTEQTFDPDGNLIHFTDAKGHVTALEYDKAGRLTSLKTPLGQTSLFTYNKRNLIDSLTRPGNQKVIFTYDFVGRLETLLEAEGQVSYTYDKVGRPLTITQAGKTITREYDSLGRLTHFTDTEGNTLNYAYDALGRLTKLTYPDGKIVSYAYDAASRLTSVVDWAGRTTQYTYDKAGRLVETLRPNNTKENRLYDKNSKNLLVQLTDTANEKILIDQHYRYNSSGQLTRQQGTPELYDEQLAQPIEMSYDADNRLIEYEGQTLDYDPNSNLINGPFGAYAYDSRNRLLSANDLTYQYDPENRRVGVESSEGTSHFVYNPNAVLDQLLVRKGPGSSATYYVYGLGLLYQEAENQVQYYHYDRQGNTLLLTDQTGQVTDQFGYSAYGELLKKEGSIKTPFLYNGRYGVMTDSNELLYMRARYYHPRLHRFLNQDVVLGNIAEPLSLNRFAYVNGDPINHFDPFGLAALDSNRDLLDALQIALDAIGIIDPTGLADALNALLYLAQGELGQAAISAASVIPFGDIAKGGKYGAKGIKSAESSFSFGKKIENQVAKRGWDTGLVDDVIAHPHATAPSVNKATGGDATAFFNKDGSYVVRDNSTGEIIQVSNRHDPNWVPDPTIQNPYRP